MINFYKNKYREDNKQFQGDMALKISEMREASNWMEDSKELPEKMYQWFRKHLERHRNFHNDIVFVDVGAAEGAYSCAVVEYFDKFNLTVFEPDLPRLQVCVENLKTYSDKYNINIDNIQINVYEYIVSDGSKKTETLRHFTCSKTGGHAGSSRMFKAEPTGKYYHDLKFQAVKLDDFVDSYDRVDILKIDVEGAEIKVLEGSKKFIEKFKPAIFIEIHCDAENGSIHISDVARTFDEHNIDYNCREIEKHPRYEPVWTTVHKQHYAMKPHPFLEYYLLTPAESER